MLKLKKIIKNLNRINRNKVKSKNFKFTALLTKIDKSEIHPKINTLKLNSHRLFTKSHKIHQNHISSTTNKKIKFPIKNKKQYTTTHISNNKSLIKIKLKNKTTPKIFLPLHYHPVIIHPHNPHKSNNNNKTTPHKNLINPHNTTKTN
jgi:hypothetical protein